VTIELSDETQKLLEEKLREGSYPSADEVLKAALNALNELEEVGLDEETLDAIDEAEAQIDRGEVYDWKDVRERIRAKFLGH
jgi:Arc/MetJ-type ribon-helix-helix transcriptional regulator